MPTNVSINMYVRQMDMINEENDEFRVQLTFRMQWNDPRLVYTPPSELKFLTIGDNSLIWYPDVFFSNEKTSSRPGVLHPSKLVRIYPNGDILFSTIVSLVLFAPNNYSNYPFDKPVFPVRMASYGYTTDDIILIWKENNPIQVGRNVGHPSLEVFSFKTDYCTSRTNTGEYSCLLVDFFMRRHLEKFLTRTYVPTALLVFVSFTPLWLSRSSLRIILAALAFLVLTINATIGQPHRHTEIVTSLDVWIGTCIIFSLLSLLFNITLDYSYPRNRKSCNSNNEKSNEDVENGKEESTETKLPNEQMTLMRKLRLDNFVDEKTVMIFARFAFPMSFILFTIIYSIRMKIE